MKRIIAVTQVILMIILSFPECVRAEGRITIEGGTVEAGIDDLTVEVPVMITENDGFASGQIIAEWDYDAFTLTGVTYELSPNYSSPLIGEGVTSRYTIQFGSDTLTEDNTGTGTLIILQFRMNEGIKPGEYTVRLTPAEGMWTRADIDEEIGEVNSADAHIRINDDNVPEFQGHQLILSGTLALRFGLVFPEDFDETGSYVTFTINGEEQRTETADAETQNGRKIFVCYLNTLQMAEQIEAVFHYGNGQSVRDTYALTEYFEYFENNQSSFTPQTVNLVRAVADYGYHAQPYLISLHNLEGKYTEITKHYTESYDYEEIKPEVAGFTFAKGISDSAVKNASYRLSLDAETVVSVYMQVPAGTELTASATFAGKTYTSQKESSTVYVIRIPGIKASQLGNVITVSGTANGSFTIQVSALSYVRSVLNSNDYGEDAKNTVAALYKYYAAVKAY